MESSRKLISACEKIEIAQEHASDKEPAVPPVDDVEEVEDE